jgi:hypothetical protein
LPVGAAWLVPLGYTPIKGLIAALNSSFADIGKPAEIKLRIAECLVNG